MKTIEYDPNSYNTALDELVTALRAGDKVTIVPVDPYRELRKAQKEGKIVQCLQPNGDWLDGPENLGFCNPPEHYRIKPDKVKMWQWVYRSQLGRVRSTSEFFHSQEEVKDFYPHVTLLKRADWTETEV